ncbi:MAG: TRAP-type C4-dicarboxylate transport system permease small subunit [bacterium]|jgi:TRAP-type C4-dicarboxylate transport system permease small subunit
MHALRHVLFALAAAGLAFMVAALFLQVLSREFHWSVDWTEELGRFSFIAMVFFAAAYGTLTRSHLRVSVFSDLLAKVVGVRAVDLLHTVVLLFFALVMTVYSWFNFVDGLRYPNTSPAIGFNQNHLFIAMCAGFAIIFILHLRDFWILLRGGVLIAPSKELGDE